LKYLAFSENIMSGTVPDSICQLVLLEELYLGDEDNPNSNIFDGPLPSSMSNLVLLERLSLNVATLTGPLPDFTRLTRLTECAFGPSQMCLNPDFVPVNSTCNFTVLPECQSSSLPIYISTSIEIPTEITSPISQTISYGEKDPANVTLIIGLSAIAILVIVLLTAVVMILKRRKQGKESYFDLRLLPKYSSPNKDIRLMRMLASGGFGVVWKARYKGQTVALKLIRMDKYEGKEYDRTRNVKIFKMVVDEASIMELMVHERVVRFIMFEIESLGIVLEYLPLGSLYDCIQNCKGGMPWTDRYQMMLDICEGMEFLHSNVYADGSSKQVLFHQDLKSGNVLLCMEGSPPTLRGKISDFGLSCKFIFNFLSPERQSN
jgi:hypothetical protein